MFGQLKIGGDPYKIHPFAFLDIESSDKGGLLPRMTTEQKDKAFTSQISEGLLLFNTDLQLLEVYTASLGWQPVAFVESDAFQVRW